MIYKNHPKRDMIITLLILTIGIIILLFAFLPFIGIHNDLLKILIIVVALILGGYPIWKNLFSKYKKSSFETKHGRKLK